MDDFDKRMDNEGVIMEYEVVVESYCEVSICCSLDELLIMVDAIMSLEDTAEDEYALSSVVKL